MDHDDTKYFEETLLDVLNRDLLVYYGMETEELAEILLHNYFEYQKINRFKLVCLYQKLDQSEFIEYLRTTKDHCIINECLKYHSNALYVEKLINHIVAETLLLLKMENRNFEYLLGYANAWLTIDKAKMKSMILKNKADIIDLIEADQSGKMFKPRKELIMNLIEKIIH